MTFRAYAWARKNDFEKALADFNEAIRLDPKYSYAYVGRGWVWHSKQDYDKAIADYDEAIRLNSKDYTAYIGRGRAWSRKGQHEKAISDFNEAIRLNPKYAPGFENRGYEWALKEDNDKAIQDYDEAIRLDPKNAFTFANRGRSRCIKGDYDKAISDFDEAIRLRPDMADFRVGRGRVWYEKGEYEKAIADYSRAIPTGSQDAATIQKRRDQPWVVYEGHDGPGKGKNIVLVSGDDEYRSEEGLPQLAKILAVRNGFHCTVLFAIDPKDGTIKPDQQDNIPGLEALDSADLMVILARFRDLPDEQMQHIVNYVESGKPIVALRTATHAFAMQKHKKFARYDWQSREWDGGFGRHVLGETWIAHHGQHGKQSTRGIIPAGGRENHPILRGIHDGDMWGPTDVYATRDRMPGCLPLVLGQVVEGMHPTDPPAKGAKNDPMMPIAWITNYESPSGKTARVFTTTMGASQDLENEGLRRLLVNACYWALGMEDQIPEKSNVDLVGAYHPTPFGFNKFTKGVKPSAHALRD